VIGEVLKLATLDRWGNLVHKQQKSPCTMFIFFCFIYIYIVLADDSATHIATQRRNEALNNCARVCTKQKLISTSPKMELLDFNKVVAYYTLDADDAQFHSNDLKMLK
jgi:hypothetical protein